MESKGKQSMIVISLLCLYPVIQLINYVFTRIISLNSKQNKTTTKNYDESDEVFPL